MRKFALSFFILILSCSDNPIILWENYDESQEIITNATIENKRRPYTWMVKR